MSVHDGVPSGPMSQLHNGACQTMTAIHLYATVLAKKVHKTCPELTPQLKELEMLIDRARRELNDVVKNFR